MFDNTFSEGSVVGVLLLVFSVQVAIELLRRSQSPVGRISGPAMVNNTIGTIFVFSALPCIVWPYIYIASHDGFWAGLVAWLVLQLVGGYLTLRLGLAGAGLGIFSLLAVIALPIGYYLTITSWP